ncbi:hypothetical protein AAIB46_14450 [Streptomyces sp. 35M1]
MENPQCLAVGPVGLALDSRSVQGLVPLEGLLAQLGGRSPVKAMVQM